KSADDLESGHRYNAACAASLAAAGQGRDAGNLKEKERSRLRLQALSWLREDLARRAAQAASGKPKDRDQVRRKLRHSRQDRDLGGLRDEAAVRQLPRREREASEQLWAEVDALLAKVSAAG